MRSDARPHSRLVTYLRDEFGNDEIACNLARLLVGPDGTPIETGLLWWSVRRDLAPEHVPAAIRQRWMQGLRVASGADASARSCPQPPARLVDDAEANAYKSGITDRGGGSLSIPDGLPIETRSPNGRQAVSDLIARTLSVRALARATR
jgi:hypothetical protein